MPSLLHTSNVPVPPTRYVPMAMIVLAHLVLLYTLQQGKIYPRTPTLQTEVTISLIQAAHAKPDPFKPKQNAREAAGLPQEQILSSADIPQSTLISQADHVLNVPAISPTAITAIADNSAASASITPTTKLVSAVEYLRSPQADYPTLARRMGEEGKVIMRVLVNEKGYAEKVDIQKSSGFTRLDEAAKAAVMRALFKPYIEDGKPLVVLATAIVSFSLNS
jgi:periplasmic protein TonB